MIIKVERKWKKAGYTIGVLSIDGKRICDTLEPTDRGLRGSMSRGEIREKKIYGKTAILTGRYEVKMGMSVKFKARRPRIVGVKGFEGILIHEGNTAKDTQGCILVGDNREVGKVLYSHVSLGRITEKIIQAEMRGEEVTITIV